MKIDELYRIIAEFQGGFGMFGGMGTEPRFDTSGVRGQGSRRNFMTVDREKTFPYDEEDDDVLGKPSGITPWNAQGATGFNKAPDRGSGRGRPDVSGGPPTPSSTYEKTWQDMRDEEGGVIDDNKEVEDMMKEAMGQPSVNAPGIVPYDGPTMGGLADAEPIFDADGNPITEPQIPHRPRDMRGPRNMMASTIPGNNTMNIREFFDPSPVDSEHPENDDPAARKDQSDEEVENDVNRTYGKEDNDDFKSSKSSGKSSSSDLQQMFGGNMEPEPGETEEHEEMETPEEEAAEHDDSSAAGMISLGGEPAGVISLGTSEDIPGSHLSDTLSPGGPEDPNDSANFQMTMKPDAGEIPKLSQFMEPSDALGPQAAVGGLGSNSAGGARGNFGMIPGAKPLSPPTQSAWDEIALQVGDAVINLKKNGM